MVVLTYYFIEILNIEIVEIFDWGNSLVVSVCATQG